MSQSYEINDRDLTFYINEAFSVHIEKLIEELVNSSTLEQDIKRKIDLRERN